jgi:aryl-alcohol dehydrogenase-like predicted oxidoreductase
VIAIPGATRPIQAEQSAGAMGFRLSGAELSRLDEVSRSYARRADAGAASSPAVR